MQRMLAFCSTMPSGLCAAAMVALGWMLARVARPVLTRVLTVLLFDRLCERLGVSGFLRRGEVRRTPAQLVGRFVYWLILAFVFLETARLLDITAVTKFRQQIVASLPGFLSGGLVLAVGLIAVGFLTGFVRTLSRNAGNPYAELWARITKWTGTLLACAVAFEQADVHGAILASTFQILIAAIALGAAIAFGLGSKDIARHAMERFLNYLKERHTDTSKPDMEG